MIEQRLLERSLPVDPERPLEAEQRVGVVEGTVDPVLREAANAEVGERGEGDQPDLARNGRKRDRMTPNRHAPSLAALRSMGIGRAPEAPTVMYG